MLERNGAKIANIVETLWETMPAHYDAHSKLLITPQDHATKRFDFRISSYQPKGYVAAHSHRIQEQIYYILEGEGLMEIEGERHVVRPHDHIFIPPGVEHAIYNSGLADLVFLVITTPPTDE